MRLVDAVQYRARVEDLRFRHDHPPPLDVGDARRQPADVLLLAGGGKTKGSYNLAGIIQTRSLDALIEKIDGGRDQRKELTVGLPRVRPRLPRRSLLGAAMVQ